MRGYGSILAIQLRTSMQLALQYRADFVTEGLVEVFWTITAVVPLFVVFGTRAVVAGWSLGEAMMVTAFFTLLQSILEGAINPSMALVVEQIRKGTFDFVLLKPRDAQFLVSTSRVLPWRAINVLTAAALFVYGFVLLGRTPSPVDVLMAFAMLLAATAILYSLWMLSVSLAFYVVKIDNLTFLFGAIFDAARWPATIFRGFLRILFTFVVPLAMMTTFPAEALLGRASLAKLGTTALGAIVALAIARAVWRRAIGRYTSASS
ncbi:MAG TPA: ABC-2 family transporter protein [Labilithrix sp.]